MPYNPEFLACQKLIEKFCDNPSSWPKEIKIARKLLLLCPDLDAWYGLTLPKKINSLSYFLSSEGKDFIPESQKNPLLLDLHKFRS